MSAMSLLIPIRDCIILVLYMISVIFYHNFLVFHGFETLGSSKKHWHQIFWSWVSCCFFLISLFWMYLIVLSEEPYSCNLSSDVHFLGQLLKHLKIAVTFASSSFLVTNWLQVMCFSQLAIQQSSCYFDWVLWIEIFIEVLCFENLCYNKYHERKQKKKKSGKRISILKLHF